VFFERHAVVEGEPLPGFDLLANDRQPQFHVG
jgi:hypothetical protein